MSFINFNNRTAPEAGTYSARMIAEALYQVETKNINKIKSLVESIKEPLATAEALKMFENKLVALNALQTAAANAMPVNEGQFSWMTQDTGEQIGSEKENRITVFMYDNEGNQYKEDKYDGYGEFGGMDYYELLAKMNGYSEEDLEEVKGPFKEMRQLGIDLAFGKLKTKDKGRKVLFPALVTDPRYNWKKHDFTQEAESDPDQSWYVEPEYDEDYYEAQKVEEAKSIAKIQKEWAKVTAMMKDTVDKWKAAEGQEKEDLLTQLKTLTISKKKLEVELDDAVGLKDADAELVGEAKNEIKYYKTVSKKDWEKAPKDYKSTIDGEHYMMFLDDKLGSILAPVKVEEAYTEDDINGKTLKKEMDKVIAANEGLNWDSLIEKVKNTAVNEWGSSDQSIMNKAIHKDAGSPKKMPSPFDSKLRAAAESAVDFYWDDWKEYETDRDGLIDNAVRGYLRSYFKKDWDLMVRMFEPVDESVEVNEADMNDPVLMAFRAAKMKREKELAKPKRKPLYGKQREKAEDDLWQISQDLKDLYADRGQMLIDMEQEAEVEGGPIADEYGDKLNKIEDEIQKLIAKRAMLEIKLAESVEVVEDLNERSINKIQKDWAKVTADMKTTVDAWKGAEGAEKEKMLAKLKELTAKKKGLEAELDDAVGLKDADAELVGEAAIKTIHNMLFKNKGFKDIVKGERATAIRKEIEAEGISTKGVSDDELIQIAKDLMNESVSLSEATMQEIDKKVQKFVIKNANDYDYSNQDSAFQIYLSLKKLYPSLIKESVVTEGKNDFMARYKDTNINLKKAYNHLNDEELNQLYLEIGELIADNKLKVKDATFTFESAVTEEEDYSDEMSYGQLESCIDNSTMIRDRIKQGVSLDPWMHSQIAVAKNELTSVFDALDGDDGVVETVTNEAKISKMSTEHLKKMIKQAEDERVSPSFAMQIKAARAELKKRGESMVESSVVTEAKALDRDAMIDWLDQTLSFTRTSEEFDGAKGGIWTTGENGEEWKGKVIYAYYSEDYKNRTFGVLNSWEKELNKRGWYSEWYDAGTVMIWPN